MPCRRGYPLIRAGASGGWGDVPCAGGLAWGVPVAGSLRCLADGSRVAVAMYRRFWWLQLGEQEFLRTLMLCATRGGGFDRHSGVTVIAGHGSPSGKLVRVMAGGEAGALHSFAVAHEDGSKGRFWSGRPWSCDQDVQVCHDLGDDSGAERGAGSVVDVPAGNRQWRRGRSGLRLAGIPVWIRKP